MRTGAHGMRGSSGWTLHAHTHTHTHARTMACCSLPLRDVRASRCGWEEYTRGAMAFMSTMGWPHSPSMNSAARDHTLCGSTREDRQAGTLPPNHVHPYTPCRVTRGSQQASTHPPSPHPPQRCIAEGRMRSKWPIASRTALAACPVDAQLARVSSTTHETRNVSRWVVCEAFSPSNVQPGAYTVPPAVPRTPCSSCKTAAPCSDTAGPCSQTCPWFGGSCTRHTCGAATCSAGAGSARHCGRRGGGSGGCRGT